MSTIGQDLKRRRQDKHLSQRKLGELADLSPNRVSDIENGRIVNITIATLERLYRALDATLPWDNDGIDKGRYLLSSLAGVARYRR